MKSLIFKNEMNFQTIDELIAEIEIVGENEAPTKIKYKDSKGNETEVEQFVRKIYFSTNGGIISTSKILVDYVNNNEQFYFIFVANDELSSAGFETFIRLNCEKYVLDGTFAVVHVITCDLDSRETLKKDSIQKSLLKMLKDDIKQQVEFHKSVGMDEKHIKKIIKGENVFLSKEEIEKLI